MAWLLKQSGKLIDVTAQASVQVTEGKIYLQRISKTERRLLFDSVKLGAALNGSLMVLPNDRPNAMFADVIYGVNGRVQITIAGNVGVWSAAAGTLISGSLHWSTAGVQS